MAVSTKVIPQPVTVPIFPMPDFVWKLSIGQYHDMIAAGILNEDDPVELLEGVLVTKMAKNPPHRIVTQLTHEILLRLTPIGWYVDSQEPITLKDSEPEPDVTIFRGDRRQHLHHHPGADETVLVIEVADSSLSRDRGLKKRIYARAGIPVYWIVNLAERKVEVYSEPSGTNYLQQQDYSEAEEVPVVIEGKEVGRFVVSELLP